MKRLRLTLVAAALLIAAGGGAAAVRSATKSTAETRGGNSGREVGFPPRAVQRTLPAGWKVVPVPPGFQPKSGGGAAGEGNWDWPESADRLVRESVIVVAGRCAGNDGSFYKLYYRGDSARRQYTTYYLRVERYLKDATGKRASYLKILAPGGFLDGGEGGGEGIFFPYLEVGSRYLLYLTPNTGFNWGMPGTVEKHTVLVGAGDEYWTTGRRHGRCYEDKQGKLSGQVFDEWEWKGLGLGLPFGKAVARVSQAVTREQRGLPPVPRELPSEPDIIRSPEYRERLLQQEAERGRKR